ncbi:cysteinyl leukotriene receptor 1-like [Diretmus argenteus]
MSDLWLHPSSPPPPSLLDNHTLATAAVPPSNQTVCFHDYDTFKYRAYTITYLLLFPVALLSNIGALVVFLLQTRRRSASCVIMINLALSDTGFSLTLPLRLVYYFRGAVWNFPDWLCRMCVYCFYVNLHTSILFLTLLSVLRWLAVTHPLRHRSLATPTRCALVCVAVWVFVGVASFPFLAGLPRCFEPSSPASWGRVLILNYVGLSLGFLLPFFTIISCYGSIVRRLMARNGPHGNSVLCNKRRWHHNQRSVKLVAMVTATFLLCFLPYHVARSLHLHAVCSGWRCVVKVTLQRVVVVTLCLAASNSVVNPLLYYYSTRTFRDSMREAQSSLLSSRGSLTFGTGLTWTRRRNTS